MTNDNKVHPADTGPDSKAYDAFYRRSKAILDMLAKNARMARLIQMLADDRKTCDLSQDDLRVQLTELRDTFQKQADAITDLLGWDFV